MGNLIRHLAGRHAVFLAVSGFILGGFEFLISGIVSTVNVSGALQELLKYTPPFMQTIIMEQFLGGLSSKSILAFGWNHPISLALGAAVAIVLASRAVAGEIESGVLELTLSQPISRSRYICAQILFALGSLAAVSLLGAAGTLFGERAYGLDLFPAGVLLKLAFGFFLLQAAWYGIALALSVFAREIGRVATAGFLLALTSYLISVIAKLWKHAAFLLPYSINTYFSPQSVLVDGTLEARAVLILSAVFLVSSGIAFRRFSRRDIP